MIGFGIGLRRKRGKQTLDVYYPQLFWEVGETETAVLKEYVSCEKNETIALTTEALAALDAFFPLSVSLPTATSGYSTVDFVLTVFSDATLEVSSIEDAFFRLQAISQRCVVPHEISLNGLFPTLLNLAWTNVGPVLLSDLDQVRLEALLTGQQLVVSHVDKFPYMVQYHVPSGVRIASGSQVRLGAYLGEGTTVMPAGYINFNAGTKGNAMVEGRISAGVVVGKDSDVGGGASIMGTLSGGNNHIITIGEQCLLGANSGTGISLGKGCTIAAGLYIYAGMKICLQNNNAEPVDINGKSVSLGENLVKAMELSGRDFLLFIQDSITGAVICKPNQKVINLNAELHQHN